jgi:transposase InsO family protein
VRPQTAERVHQRWIMDFKVDIQLADGQWVHLHTVRDPVGAAFVGAGLYPAGGKRAAVRREHVQEVLRTSFAHFGLPEEVQTDWEAALHSQPGDTFPGWFTLWLVGLGIDHVHARPGVPTDDAEVERGHRTLYEYALADHLNWPLERLGPHLQQACHELNAEYPSRAHGCQACPPLQAHPELLHPPRPFDLHQELARFDLQRVDAFLASLTFERKVGKFGQISIGKHHTCYSLGRAWAGRIVQVRFDPSDRCFVASANDQPIRRWKAKHLEIEDMVGFSSLTPCLLPQQLPLPFAALQGSGCELPKE